MPGSALAAFAWSPKDGPIVSYGTLDPQALQKPATFADWMKKTMGMEWGS